MRTKDEIIEYQSKLLRELLKIGQDKIQEVMDLMCEIDMLPKDFSPITHVARMANVVRLEDHVQKKEKICPKCKKNERPILKSGKRAPYCRPCNAERTRESRKNLKKE